MTVRRSLAIPISLLAVGAAAADGRTSPLRIDDLRCVRGCAGPRTVAAGSAVRFEGGHLAGVREVRFRGEAGPVVSTPFAAGPHAVKVTVPDGAATGRPLLLRSDGTGGRAPLALRVVPPGRLPPPGSFDLKGARADPRDAFFDQSRPLRFRYRFASYGRLTLELQVVRRATGEVVRRFHERRALPFATRYRSWNGLRTAGGVTPDGRYRLRVEPRGDNGEAGGGFQFHGHLFPVRGAHTYGDGIGAGRGHQGQDVLAACGTPLVAARGGVVQWKAYQAGGYGYYVVIDGRATGEDYLYGHLAGPAWPTHGERVRAGERIGTVGRTGNATGCHLHFELWSEPGWHAGGHFTNPTDDLRNWDSWS